MTSKTPFETKPRLGFNDFCCEIFVGVDVSKATHDVYRPDINEVSKIENADEAIELLCSQLKKMKPKKWIVMEGTGGYEYLLLKHLASHKLEAAVVNPRRVRDFAKGIGLDARPTQSMPSHHEVCRGSWASADSYESDHD